MAVTKKRPGDPEPGDRKEDGPEKRPKLDKAALLARVREKSRLVQDKLSSIKAQKLEGSTPDAAVKEEHGTAVATRSEAPSDSLSSRRPGVGLNVPLHPLFTDLTLGSSTEASSSGSGAKNKYLEELLNDGGTSAGKDLIDGNPYFDHSLESGHSKVDRRARRGLVFNPKGKYIAQAETIRHEKQIKELEKAAEAKKKAGELGTDVLAGELRFKPEKPPGIEWWDKELLSDLSADNYGSAQINFGPDSPITIYVQHPIPLAAPWEKNMPKEVKLHLTKKEFKRIRKLDRSEKHKEIQDRIRLGLDPTPPPKIKPSNVMNVFTNEAIKDPTLLEKMARDAVEERRKKHEEVNLARKLTPEEHYEKFVAKLEKEKGKGLYSAVFKIDILKDGRHKFLVNYNAKKLQLTGMVIFNPKFCLVVVEGGLLAIKKFSRLLMVRMKWTENAPPKEGQTDALPDLSKNRCTLVWSGQLKANKFKRWSLHDADTEQDAKELLGRQEAENYWLEARSL